MFEQKSSIRFIDIPTNFLPLSSDADNVLAVVDRLVVLGFYRKLQSKGPVPLHWQMQRGYKTYKNVAVRTKTLYIHCVLIVYAFHTLYPSSIRTL